MFIKRVFLTLFIVLVFFSSLFTKVNAQSWYFKKNGNNQPELKNDLKIIEKYEVYWCDEKHTSIFDDDKVIYLTFDAGYENGNIEKILDVLKAENVQGNFFILENLILKNKDLVGRMINEGHTIANHTATHKDMTKLNSIEDFKSELCRLEKTFEDAFGQKMEKYYRPPEGKFNEKNLAWATELGYKTVFWSFAYEDWKNNDQKNCQESLEKIINNLHNGEVILLHPTSATNASIMKELIQYLKNEGFRFGDLNELCQG